jgi:hypothetical protein
MSSGFIAFTVAAVPTGMKAGVWISPRAIAMTPVRAAPSVAELVKENAGIARARSRATAAGTGMIVIYKHEQ